MRSEKEMFELILGTARRDERIRAVILNGSRANPHAPRDFFQDFDIVYLVNDIGSFTCDHGWVRIFGERMIMQMPKTMTAVPDEDDGSFSYLMQFTDGNRIDLTLIPADRQRELLGRDSESVLLLDKDGTVEPFPPASDGDYHIQPPTAKQFRDCCNEFWWISTYVAKGIWRDELPYAMQMFHDYLRAMLNRMLQWQIGTRLGFGLSTGKMGKYFKRYLDRELWEMYAATYAGSDYRELWQALFTACALFRRAAGTVAERFGYTYPQGEDDRVTAHLIHVSRLPRDAVEMY